MFAIQWFWRLCSILLIIILCFLWQYFVSNYANTELVPTPLQVWEEFLDMQSEGIIVLSIQDSLYRFFLGFCIGSVCAVMCGLIFGYYRNLEILFEPLLQILRPISPIAWFPLVLLWLNIGDMPAIFVIAYAVFFPILALCITGVRQIDKDFIAMARNFGANSYKIFYHIILPGTFLHISSGLKLAASVAWIHLVAGEMLGAQTGLGYIIIDGRNFLNTPKVLVGVILIGLLGYIIYEIFVLLEKLVGYLLGRAM
ncbi:ABC transporter permease [Helicobacter didelphidarum]|uniref:ABC transporter permease n=1 Tax=Helicobacter didelphidarum TaxID=2040648 RepID=A0A3D8IR99_9HELI|nr:ABC transporter permease [Helicobacter didelphidarum]RDU67124.1 ABC transporter permease [Helicobacter didelphidarum]